MDVYCPCASDCWTRRCSSVNVYAGEGGRGVKQVENISLFTYSCLLHSEGVMGLEVNIGDTVDREAESTFSALHFLMV